ncbi:alpha/beta hydrolase [Kocuria dechangensis]|uniref:Alpha/beta hydrolase n=1 Tax=Kocuria dechangensis TaxID=1176249 RepID=A0A917LTN9_9MICC|nr:alpha/beta fold hydrolase [Kocuria dechangensis]GGG56247.1 alpha/beta hydrolase [Kocuria dechangensis]
MLRRLLLPPPAAPVPAPASQWARGAVVGAGVTVGAASLTFGLSSAAAAYFARQVVVPPKYRSEDLPILGVTRTGEEGDPAATTLVRLPATVDTTVAGTYSLRFDAGRGHARIGAIRAYSPQEGTVTRVVEEVYSGDLRKASRGFWSGTVYPDPGAAGLPFEEVEIPIEVGPAPCWVVPAEGGPTPEGERPRELPGPWAVMVHGRGASRMEAVRAVPVARELGLTSLLISYRNDREAPPSHDNRYGLGFTEWKDVQTAISYAKSRGATQIVLFGWSMGGAIALQTADLSFYRDDVAALVLTGPVVDWYELIAHHSRTRRIPSGIGRLATNLISHPAGRMLTGLAAPVDLKALDWLSRSEHLRAPTLIMHSVDDEFVPAESSRRLAELNPLAEFVPFARARHTKEWNVDPRRWEDAVRRWLPGRLAQDRLVRRPSGERARQS